MRSGAWDAGKRSATWRPSANCVCTALSSTCAPARCAARGAMHACMRACGRVRRSSARVQGMPADVRCACSALLRPAPLWLPVPAASTAVSKWPHLVRAWRHDVHGRRLPVIDAPVQHHWARLCCINVDAVAAIALAHGHHVDAACLIPGFGQLLRLAVGRSWRLRRSDGRQRARRAATLAAPVGRCIACGSKLHMSGTSCICMRHADSGRAWLAALRTCCWRRVQQRRRRRVQLQPRRAMAPGTRPEDNQGVQITAAQARRHSGQARAAGLLWVPEMGCCRRSDARPRPH